MVKMVASGIVASILLATSSVSLASNKFSIAHLNESGQDMIIVPLEGSTFHGKSQQQKNEISQALQLCAVSARLKGTVVPVWQIGGQMYFMAPGPWQGFFREVTMEWIQASINKELTCR